MTTFNTVKERERVRILHWREIHEIVKTVGSAGLFVAVVALVLTIRHEIPRIRTEVLPNITSQLIATTKSEGEQTRAMISTMAKDLSGKFDERAKSVQGALLEAVGRTESDANDRIKDVVGLAEEQLGKVNATLDNTQKSVDKIASLADPLSASIKQANASMRKIDDGIVAPLTDCENNPSCFENRWIGISNSVEMTLRAISTETPKMAAALQKNADTSADVLTNVAGITGDIHEFTDKFVHPPKKKWYQHIEDWFLGAAKMTIYAFK
jgi:hypothetical protein